MTDAHPVTEDGGLFSITGMEKIERQHMQIIGNRMAIQLGRAVFAKMTYNERERVMKAQSKLDVLAQELRDFHREQSEKAENAVNEIFTPEAKD